MKSSAIAIAVGGVWFYLMLTYAKVRITHNSIIIDSSDSLNWSFTFDLIYSCSSPWKFVKSYHRCYINCHWTILTLNRIYRNSRNKKGFFIINDSIARVLLRNN